MVEAPSRLFVTEKSTADFEIGAEIYDLDYDICQRIVLVRNFTVTVAMRVKWEVYSRRDRKVILRFETAEKFRENSVPLDQVGSSVLTRAFVLNAARFSSSEEVRKLKSEKAQTAEAVKVYTQPVIKLVNPMTARQQTPISDAVGSVVAVFGDGGHGSGFLVSAEGYLITNHHVVENAKFVKIRWSDDFETVGEVVRSDKRRDVALIKADPRGRQPLGLRSGPVPTGDEVYAIGAPLDPALQNTVTRGIVSANRVIDGFTFLQSDVQVIGGNSGGPLIDRNGRVVAICVSGKLDPNSGATTGINFFIPIRDALDFLSLEAAVPVPAS